MSEARLAVSFEPIFGLRDVPASTLGWGWQGLGYPRLPGLQVHCRDTRQLAKFREGGRLYEAALASSVASLRLRRGGQREWLQLQLLNAVSEWLRRELLNAVLEWLQLQLLNAESEWPLMGLQWRNERQLA